VPVGGVLHPHAGCFRTLSESTPEIGTRWRSEVNSNCRYRFVNSQTTASVKLCYIETNCKALCAERIFWRALGSALERPPERRGSVYSRLTDVPTAASKVNVEVADSTYWPADAAFENLEEARDDLLIIAAEHPRRGVPAVLDR
jgi:hypothetical protein